MLLKSMEQLLRSNNSIDNGQSGEYLAILPCVAPGYGEATQEAPEVLVNGGAAVIRLTSSTSPVGRNLCLSVADLRELRGLMTGTEWMQRAVLGLFL